VVGTEAYKVQRLSRPHALHGILLSCAETCPVLSCPGLFPGIPCLASPMLHCPALCCVPPSPPLHTPTRPPARPLTLTVCVKDTATAPRLTLVRTLPTTWIMASG
jgi:hypothetical protein